MIQFSINFDLVDQGLFTILFLEGTLFWKCFNSIFFFVFIFYDQVDRGKVTFTNFFYRFEKFMKATLIKYGLKLISPFNELLFIIAEELYLRFEPLKLKSKR